MKSLNHIFRTIWSEALGVWIAVSELTKSKGKRSISSCIRAVRIDWGSSANDSAAPRTRLKPILFAVACCFAFNAQANPIGGAVVNGQASFNTSGSTLTVTNTPGTIINWQGFSINANEVTHFAQQSAASTVLNRVVTNNPSVILGTLSSNGQVYLVNANGIMFGAGSTVDVAGLVATTLNLSDADFLAGRHNYTAVAGAGNVSNVGNVKARQNGFIYLIAPNVENSGVITAPNGEILLAAGAEVQLVNGLDPNLRVSITAPAGNATNLGQLIAESGSLGLFGTMVKNSGTVNADSATMQGGKIVFKASQTTEVTGIVSATGTTGGNIEILGSQVALLGNASVDASGVNGGGTVLVGGDAHGANANVQNAQVAYVDAGVTIKADALQNGDGGKVVVWSDNVTQFSGNISARGGALSGNGGWVETSGKKWLGFAGLVDTRAVNGVVGSLLLDPEDITISTALDSNVTWGGTSFAGTVATGNLNVTTLQNQLALTNVTVDTNSTGPNPGNITVQNAIVWGGAGVNTSLILNAVGTGAITTNAPITNNGTGGLTVQTVSGAITLNAGISTNNGSFTATAGGGGALSINAPVSTGSGAVNLTSTASSISESGTGLISTTGLLTTNSYGATTLNGANSVGSLLSSISATGATVFSFNNATTAAYFYINGISNTMTGGSISVTNAGSIMGIIGNINAGSNAVNLTNSGATGGIWESGAVISTTGTLTTINGSASGTSLNGGTNMVGTYNAADVGSIYLKNGTALNISGITASDVLIYNYVGAITVNGAVTAPNGVTLYGIGLTNNSSITGGGAFSAVALGAGIAGFGTGTLANAGTISNGGGTNTGTVTLTGDKMTLGGTITAGAGAVNINNLTLTDAIDIGSGGSAGNLTLELSNAELATISTTGLLSIGNTGNSGAINISAPMTFSTNAVLANGTGGIVFNGAITATGKNLTLNTSGAVTQAAGADIAATGLELLGTGSYTLTNSTNSVSTVAGNAGSISLVDSTALSVGTVNTAGLTSTGSISLASAGAISQTSLISSSGLTTSSIGGTTLNGANTVTSFSATNTTSGNIALTNTAATLTAFGINNTATGGSITVNNAGSISIMGTIVASGGAINLTSLGSIAETSTGQISTTGLLTTSSVNGQNLVPLGTNTVGSFNATNTKIGAINFTNVGAPLTVTGLSQIGSGAVNVSNTGDLSITGTITTSGTAATAVTLVSTGNVVVGGATTATGGGALNLILNHGAAGSATLAGNLDLVGGSIDVQNAGVSGTGTLNVSAGAISKSGALTTAALVNNGSMYLSGTGSSVGALTQKGLLDIAAGGTLSVPSFTNTGTLSGAGTFNVGPTGTITNNGIIAPGGVGTVGTLSITGNLVMGATGAVNVELSSPVPGNYDVLNVSGTATLTGGTLNIVGGSVGSFDVLNATGGLGATKFASINGGIFDPTPTYTTNLFTVDLKYRMLTGDLLSEFVKDTLIYPIGEDGKKRGPRLASNDSGRAAPRGVAPKTVCQ